MPEVLCNTVILPERFEVPESLVYQYMIWALAKFYKLSPHVAGKMKETDFWQMTAFEELELAKTEYLLKLRTGS
ncbi:MAG: hypothetical protein ABI543_13180 [Ignavibacteria bacterium]